MPTILRKSDEVEKGSRGGDVHTHIYNEIYLKKLAHTNVLLWIWQVCTLGGRLGTQAGVGYVNSKIHRASWQSRNSSRVTMSTVFSQNPFFSGKRRFARMTFTWLHEAHPHDQRYSLLKVN